MKPAIRIRPLVAVGLVLHGLAACRSSNREAVASNRALLSDSAAGRWIDLTHPFGPRTICWPTARPFELTVVARGRTPQGHFYASNDLALSEHCGTHLDAPLHFVETGESSTDIPLERLVAPIVVVDVSDSAAADATYKLTAADLERWETRHGPIPSGAAVVVRTGWYALYDDRAKYLGTALTGAAAAPELRFPTVDESAARRMVERRIDLLVIDTPSSDLGPPWPVHIALSEANVPMIENAANLGALPETGAQLFALPMLIDGGTGGPARLLALVPRSGASPP